MQQSKQKTESPQATQEQQEKRFLQVDKAPNGRSCLAKWTLWKQQTPSHLKYNTARRLKNYLQSRQSNISILLHSYYNPFIHSRYFYIASSSRLLFRGIPDYSIDTVTELTRQSATGNCKWRTCPRSLTTRRLEWDLNPRPSGRKAANLPLSHHAHNNNA